MKNNLIIIFLQFSVFSFSQKIVIDPGHGWGASQTTGGCANPDTRLAIEMSASFNVGTILKNKIASSCPNWQAKLTRTSNNCNSWITLSQRVSIANSWGADMFLSLHTNAANGTANGSESFYCSVNPQPNTLEAAYCKTVQAQVVAQTGMNNRRAVDDITYLNYDLYVLKNTTMLAVLNEMGFGDNSSDYAKLSNPFWQDKYATGHLKALQIMLNDFCPVTTSTIGTLSNPLSLSCNTSYSGTTTDGLSTINNYTSCGNQNEYGKEKVYSFTLSQPSNIQIALTNLSTDLDIQLLSAPNATSCIYRHDNTIYASNLPVGTYYAVVDGFGTSSSTSGTFDIALTCTSVVTTNLDVDEINNKISVYPNPASNKLNIDFINYNDEYMVVLFDEIGRIIYSSNTNKSINIDVSAFKNGIYFLRFDHITSKHFFYKKVIISNNN